MKYSPHVHMELQVCVLFTYYGACVLVLDIDLPEQPALIVLIHGAWKQDKRPMNTIIKSQITPSLLQVADVWYVFEKRKDVCQYNLHLYKNENVL